MIPTRPQKKRSEVAETPVEAVRTHVGLQEISRMGRKGIGH